MTYNEAVRVLRAGGEWVELAEAIGVVISSPMASLLDLVLGLKHGGMVAEQAALALYKKTGQPLPDDHSGLITDITYWASASILAKNTREATVESVAARGGTEGSAVATVDEPGLKDVLRDFITRELSCEERLILVLHYFEEMSLPEIAELLGTSERQLRQTHAGILEQCRASLAPDLAPLSNLLRDIAAEVAA